MLSELASKSWDRSELGEHADKKSDSNFPHDALARRITQSERIWKWCRRNPRVAALGTLAATLIFVLLCGGYLAAGINHKSAYACLCGAIGYALASQHVTGSQQQALIDRALHCATHAVTDLGFRDFTVLQTDPDFALLRRQSEFRRLILLEEASTDAAQ